MIPGVHVYVPVVVITFLRLCRPVKPAAAARFGARLRAAADDELAVVEHVARPGDVHGDPEVGHELLPLSGHRLVVNLI